MRGRIDPHARYRELIAARLDKPLTRVELRTLTAHFKKCAACQALDGVYRDQRSMLRALPAPIPPRDMWARTSASLDREVGRAYRAQRWRRRLVRGARSAQPSTALMSAVAVIGVTAAIVVLQLAPAIGPGPSVASRPTPLAVSPQQFAFLAQGGADVSLYRTDVSQVCPPSGPQDCVPAGNYTRTPVGLPSDMRAGNISLSPSGKQLAIVGHRVGEDVIAVVEVPPDSNDVSNSGPLRPPKSGSGGQPDSTNAGGGPGATRTHAPDGSGNPGQTPDPNSEPSTAPLDNPGQSATPPASAVPGLAVLSILDNVQSAGSAPDWSPNGETLAFSAMPDDGSSGPDVYIWQPGDAKARAITSDHGSYFASWSGNRIVFSQLSAGSTRPHNFVIDPDTLEQRAVAGPEMWLPSVNKQRTQAVGWFGQLDTTGALPAPGSGALYLMDWASVDPFSATAVEPQTTPAPTDQPAATPDDSAQATPAPDAGSDQTPAPDATAAPVATDGPADGTNPQAPGATAQPDGGTPANAGTSDAADSLVPLEPDRDPRAAPVVDWQARWSPDGQVLGVWIADSADSTWGRLAVFAVDPITELVSVDNPLLPMTLARRGFSLGTNRVAWVGPADDNVDGDLRIRTWGSDGVGGLRLKAPEQEQVVPAS